MDFFFSVEGSGDSERLAFALKKGGGVVDEIHSMPMTQVLAIINRGRVPRIPRTMLVVSSPQPATTLVESSPQPADS